MPPPHLEFMHILCIYQYYNTPDTPGNIRLYSLLHELGKQHQISLITTRYFMDQQQTDLYPEAPAGVDISYLDVPYNNHMNTFQRLPAYSAFSLKALMRGRKIHQPDLIWGISTPLSIGWAASRLARYHRVPWLFEVRDLWPDFPIQMGAFSSPLITKPLRAWERRLYETADRIIATSPDMTRHIQGMVQHPEKVSTSLHGTNPEMIACIQAEEIQAMRDRWGLQHKKVVIYGGKFGRANDAPTLLAAAKQLADHPDMVFVFAGFGFYDAEIAETAKTSSNLLYIPTLSHHDMLRWYTLADISIVPFIGLPVLSVNSPAKFFDSLGCGTPVVVTNPGWTKTFVEEHQCGWYTPPADPNHLAETICAIFADESVRAAAGKRGKIVADRLFDRKMIAGELNTILEQMIA